MRPLLVVSRSLPHSDSRGGESPREGGTRMSIIWSLAKKELRLLLRDPLAVGVLVGMPLLFILVLGLLLGESFGQKPDDTLRITVVNLDTQGTGLHGKPWSYWVQQD